MTQDKFDYIEFQEGMFGFEQYTKFIPLMVEDDSDAVVFLQSAEDEDLSFLIMNPFMLCEDYNPVLSDEDYAKIGTNKQEELSFYVICVAKESIEESTINMKCPIVVNTVTRQARQVILDSKEYKFRHFLKEFRKEEA
ncbi:MAG: flagellar assembly protein FliW [Firmicutes bacterium]|nr:flagellar assembly protein FliW [Bacillota bacterium]